jgi:hypothetical protein
MQDSGHTSDWHGESVERLKANGKRVFPTPPSRPGWLRRLPGVRASALAMRHEINANQLRRQMRLEHWLSPLGRR